MTRSRRPILLATVSACLILSAAMATALGQQGQGVDPERGFSFGDTDLDGKLTLAEFRDLLQNAPRQKNAPAKKALGNPDTLFPRLDLDHDGSLSLEEYRQLGRARPGLSGQGAGGGFFKAGLAKSKAAPTSSTKAATRPPEVVEKPITPEQARFFEAKIRPVLANKCGSCHSQEAAKLKGGLLVDSREGLRKGGDTGPAVVPGNLEESLLIAAIRYGVDTLQMPPKAKLPDAVIADFEAWVAMGAPDPRQPVASKSVAASSMDIEKARQSWAFQAPRAAQPPRVLDDSWPMTNVDRFVLAAIEARGLKPVADANRHSLIRRVTFDLIGLPPTPEEVRAFTTDGLPDAFARVVDRLLASPRFGERWGRHWLDVARFAESSGKANMMYPQAWRYRDWVIASINADKPYDQFVKEQVAGDLLGGRDDQTRADRLIATGFLAIGGKTQNTQDRKQFLVDLADEQLDVTSQAFLGLTVACARCHDHKFDPISQRDYYALSGIFQSTQTRYGTLPGIIQNVNPSPLIELPEGAKVPSALPSMEADRRVELEAQLAGLVKARDALTPEQNFSPKGFQTRNRLAMLRFRLASYRADGTPRDYAMGALDRVEPVDSPLYVRGELEHPGEPIPRGVLPVLSRETPPTITQGSGRKELADWLASPQNPLTARVMVNRVWLHLFGRGLVATPDNFGVAGQPPTHPELLDTMAASFMEQGWSVKRLIRQVVLSHTYQLGSLHDPKNFEVDPDNTMIWRMSPRRLEAEAIRDALLAVSGEIDLEAPVGSAVAQAGEGPAGPGRGFSQETGDRHRAVYLPVIRDQLPESLALFDFADPSLSTGVRSSTSGPTQALYLMNSPFVIRQAEAAAGRLIASGADGDARIDASYRRFLSRPPTHAEFDHAHAFFAGFADGDRGSKPAWTAFCQALYAGAEFRYLD